MLVKICHIQRLKEEEFSLAHSFRSFGSLFADTEAENTAGRQTSVREEVPGAGQSPHDQAPFPVQNNGNCALLICWEGQVAVGINFT